MLQLLSKGCTVVCTTLQLKDYKKYCKVQLKPKGTTMNSSEFLSLPLIPSYTWPGDMITTSTCWWSITACIHTQTHIRSTPKHSV